MRFRQILLIVLLGAVFAFAGYYFDHIGELGDYVRSLGTESDASQSKDEEALIGPYWEFGTVVVNLKDSDFAQSFTLGITLRFDIDWTKREERRNFENKTKEKLIQKKPILKSWLIKHLADKTANELEGGVGVNVLQDRILEVFNEQFAGDGITIQMVLFDEYMVEKLRPLSGYLVR